MAVYCIHINVFCWILVLGVYLLSKGRGSEPPFERQAFSRILSSLLVACAADVAARLSNGAQYTGAAVVLSLASLVYHASVLWLCLHWMLYVLAKAGSIELPYKKILIFSSILGAAVSVALVVNLFAGFFYQVDEMNRLVYQAGGMLVYDMLCLCSLLVALGAAIAAVPRVKTGDRHKRMKLLAVFAVFPIAAVVAQYFCPEISSLQTGFALAIVLNELMNLSAEIFRDALTELNNRNAMEHYVASQLNHGSQFFTAILMDIDHFKQMNADYGRAAGDQMLIFFSNLLKKTCGSYSGPAFLFRYGGDEFGILCKNMEEKDCETFIGKFQEQIDQANREGSAPCSPLSVSVGRCTRYCESTEDVYHLLSYAYAKKCSDDAEK